MKFRGLLILSALGALARIDQALAHHSYAMFESVKDQTVTGTVAKVEWTNPHVFVWVYVPQPQNPDKYDLYAFENGTPNALELLGWSKTVFKAGDPISVCFAPLRDGRKGGHWIVGTLADGRTFKGAGGPAKRNLSPPPAPAP